MQPSTDGCAGRPPDSAASGTESAPQDTSADLGCLLQSQHAQLLAFFHQWLYRQEVLLSQLRTQNLPHCYLDFDSKVRSPLPVVSLLPRVEEVPHKRNVTPTDLPGAKLMKPSDEVHGRDISQGTDATTAATKEEDISACSSCDGLVRYSRTSSASGHRSKAVKGVEARRTEDGRGSPGKEEHPPPKPVSLLASRSSDELARKQEAKEMALQQRRNLGMTTASVAVLQKQGTNIKRWVTSEHFEWCSLAVLLLNTLFMGVEAEYASSSQSSDIIWPFVWFNMFFAAFFTFELILRLGTDRLHFFCGEQRLWNLVDFIAVGAALLEVAADLALATSQQEPGQGSVGSGGQRMVRVVRVARLVRIFRITRVVRFISSLRMLVYSIMSTMKSLGWSLVLLGAIIYSFGLFFTQAVTDHIKEASSDTEVEDSDPELLFGYDDKADQLKELQHYWGSLGSSMLTLFQSITGGISWRDAAYPLVSAHMAYQITFVCFVAFSLLAVLNVVTAVFCQTAITSAAQDQDTLLHTQEANRESYRKWVKHCFHGIDSTGNGITLLELESHIQDDRVQAFLASLEIETDDVWTLFKLLDTDGSNCISMDEFASGCSRLRGAARSVDIALLSQDMQWMMEKLQVFIKYVEEQLTTLTGDKPVENHTIHPLLPSMSFLRKRGQDEMMMGKTKTFSEEKKEEKKPRERPPPLLNTHNRATII